MDEDLITNVPVLYLDFDGTVRKGFDELGYFVNDASQVEVFPEARKLIREWKDKGGRVVGVTNQGGVGLGHVSMIAMKGALKETNRQCDDLFDRIMVCPHKPTSKCDCRKPKTFMNDFVDDLARKASNYARRGI